LYVRTRRALEFLSCCIFACFVRLLKEKERFSCGVWCVVCHGVGVNVVHVFGGIRHRYVVRMRCAVSILRLPGTSKSGALRMRASSRMLQ